jgi:hypothetical protein
MAVPKNDKYKDYARYAAHCLNMVASTRDQELRCMRSHQQSSSRPVGEP